MLLEKGETEGVFGRDVAVAASAVTVLVEWIL
jgi:hypothetical protein